MRQKLLDIVDTLFRETLIGDGAGEGSGAGGGVFSQTSFFFVAHHVASQSPDLHEAALVLSHRDALPLPSLRGKWSVSNRDGDALSSGTSQKDVSKKSRHLSSRDIRHIAVNRLHERFPTDQGRTLTGRLFIFRQVLHLHIMKWLSLLTKSISRQLMAGFARCEGAAAADPGNRTHCHRSDSLWAVAAKGSKETGLARSGCRGFRPASHRSTLDPLGEH